MKFATVRTCADPDAAARKLVEMANSVEAIQDGRIYIELVHEHKDAPAEYKAGLIWRSCAAGWCCTNPGPM